MGRSFGHARSPRRRALVPVLERRTEEAPMVSRVRVHEDPAAVAPPTPRPGRCSEQPAGLTERDPVGTGKLIALKPAQIYPKLCDLRGRIAPLPGSSRERDGLDLRASFRACWPLRAGAPAPRVTEPCPGWDRWALGTCGVFRRGTVTRPADELATSGPGADRRHSSRRVCVEVSPVSSETSMRQSARSPHLRTEDCQCAESG